MIPKIIHYCWFGGSEKSALAKKCIQSWKKYCPDYKFIEWNESNFDMNYCPYVKEAYQHKKWAFITDVVRLYALVNYGGIYMDTDVEVLKPLDGILKYEAISGFQEADFIPTGLMASVKNQELFKELLDDYQDRHFELEDGSLDTTTNCTLITNTCLKYGLVLNNEEQTVRGFTLKPLDVFCAKNSLTGVVKVTSRTLTIHHFAGSWTTPKNRLNTRIDRFMRRHFGNKFADSIRRLIKK